jgi:hypothetical protein
VDILLTSALVGGERAASHPGRVTTGGLSPVPVW